jgi:tight adherence protein C
VFEYETILPLALFGAFASITWWLLEAWTARQSRASERLDQLKSPRVRKDDDIAVKKSEGMIRVFQAATPALAKPLEPKTEVEMSKLRARLAHAGYRGEGAGSAFLGLKFLGLLIGLALGGGTFLAVGKFNYPNLGYAIFFAGACFYLPDVVIWHQGRCRKEAIFLGLPDALDLLVVCVEAGLGLDQAMRRVAEEMKNSYRIVSDEFGLSNFHLQMGRPRAEVLHELGMRCGVADVRALAAVIIQADKFGSSVAQALRSQSDSMRIRRRQMAEEKAAKTAVKLIFPLVFFIFPGIFVVLVGPAAITMIRNLFPNMGPR